MAFIGNTSTTQAFTPAVDYFNGNGSSVAFTLSRPVASVAQVQVVIENVPQNPSSAYTVSGNTITFTSAPPSGTSNIYVEYTSPITQVIAPGQGTVSTTQLTPNLTITTPTLVSPALGTVASGDISACTGTANSLNAGIGVGQTWQGVVRVNGTTYTNSSGKPIMCVYSYTGGATLYGKFTISGSVIPSSINGSATTYTFTSTVIVPNGATYVFNTNGTLAEAWELR